MRRDSVIKKIIRHGKSYSGLIENCGDGMADQEKTHTHCKNYGRKECPHLKNNIMTRAIQERQLVFNTCCMALVDFSTDEEVDALCCVCPAFGE